MKPLNKHWKAALREAFFETKAPAIGSVANPREHFTGEVVSCALLKLKYKNTTAYDLSREHSGSPEERLTKVFNEVQP